MTAAFRSCVALVFVVGCSDYNIKGIEEPENIDPRILVDPQVIQYEGTRDGETRVETVIIESVGASALTLDELRIEGSSAFTMLTNLSSTVMAPGDRVELEVAYTPVGVDDEGVLYVRSDAVNQPQALVSLLGGGLFPQLTLDPPEVDFGFVEPNSETWAPVRMINSGGDTLVIDMVAPGGHPFDAVADTPVTLEPGESAELQVGFFPDTAADWTGEAWISSNAPGPDRVLPLRGTSAVQPVAVCSVDPNPVFTLYQDATFIGSLSYDPSGLQLTRYDWSLVSRPNGSSATMPTAAVRQPNRYFFTADLAGEYTAQLIVTNEAGMASDPCFVTLVAQPAQNLWVELYWTHSGDDMDLHLLRPGGALRGTGDCYYANCAGRSLDWGVRNDSSDDPTLDIDDIPGTGPENINIMAPETGTFTVYVHDYPGSVYNGDNDVTVNIYLGGQLVWSDTKTISGENDYVPYAEIDWPDQVVRGL